MSRMAELAYEQEAEMSDMEQYQADMDCREQDCRRVIEKATHEPITADEASLLKWAAGVQ